MRKYVSLALLLLVVLTSYRLAHSEQPATMRDARLAKDFELVIPQLDWLVQQGGASVVQTETGRVFIAVGVTEIRDDSSQDKLRQIRVGRIQAQKEAVSFLERTKVVAEEKLVERTTVTTKDGKKCGEVLKTLDQTTFTSVQGMLGSLPEIGTWRSSDGKLFFYAIGRKID